MIPPKILQMPQMHLKNLFCFLNCFFMICFQLVFKMFKNGKV